MKKRKKRPKRSVARAGVAPRFLSRCRSLMVIDQEPLRKKASAECRSLRKKLEALRAELKQFERSDQPAYQRWEATQFGPMLTTLRELEQKHLELSALMNEVYLEQFYQGGSLHTAYQRVMKRRAMPAGADWDQEGCAGETDRGGFEEETPGDGEMGIDEARELFHDFLDDVMG